MKVEAHIKLEKELLDAVDHLSGGKNHRSELIEEALHAYVNNIARGNADERDVEIINQHAEELSTEALDVLDYQIPL
jgi:metal-responsive CopG/Arc/MetJ family transcriptional regulator